MLRFCPPPRQLEYTHCWSREVGISCCSLNLNADRSGLSLLPWASSPRGARWLHKYFQLYLCSDQQLGCAQPPEGEASCYPGRLWTECQKWLLEIKTIFILTCWGPQRGLDILPLCLWSLAGRGQLQLLCSITRDIASTSRRESRLNFAWLICSSNGDNVSHRTWWRIPSNIFTW